MRACVVESLSEDFEGVHMAEVPDPAPGKGEVLVRIRACLLNFPDVLMTSGGYQFKPDLPFTPGMEASGDVVALGEGVSQWSVGEPVIAGLRTGGLAEFAVASAESLRPKPTPLDYAQASGHTTANLTAYVALVRRGALLAGETLLVHGAAGGVGLAAVEMGKLLGATVIATASTEEKRALTLARGADYALPPTGFREDVKKLTGGRGADVVYDPVGGDVFDESVRCIAFDGRLLIIGFTSGRIPSVSVNMPLIKGFSVVGVRAGEYGRRFPERGIENLAAIDQWASEGKLAPHVGARLALEDAIEAMRILKERRALGKVVVEPTSA